MIVKTKLNKQERKALEREVKRNMKQKKENRKDMNRLYMYYILKKANALGWNDYDDMPKATGMRGMLA